ncbi:dihydroorotase [Acrasis kona]|uniref:Dihydroorotase n=1 Tax=Acrasis kona TaxID=1008807 RepID=A0AAW2YQL7_9EUKA
MSILIKNATLINEGVVTSNACVLVDSRGIISKITDNTDNLNADQVIDATGHYLIPGVIDAHVHFREPGLTHKGDIYSESRAAVSGGITSYMDMPNTSPQVLTQQTLEDKYKLSSQKSSANYSFFMGVSLDNIDEVLKTDPNKVCGAKIFLCNSTGDMKANSEKMLQDMFSQCNFLIATHCEDEDIVQENARKVKQEHGNAVPWDLHVDIRSERACVESTKMAVELAKKHNTRLHVVHLTTQGEVDLFRQLPNVPLEEKRITCETTPHHLWFDRSNYATLGAKLKCNPSVKEANHKEALLSGLKEGLIDMIATDHAPHTLKEKQDPSYWTCPSGLPTIQFSLNVLLEMHLRGEIELTQIVDKMCHAPAKVFQVDRRGFVREGYWADLTLFKLSEGGDENVTEVNQNTIRGKCGWSPFEGTVFRSKVTHTIVSGKLAYENGQINDKVVGERILFNRK